MKLVAYSSGSDSDSDTAEQRIKVKLKRKADGGLKQSPNAKKRLLEADDETKFPQTSDYKEAPQPTSSFLGRLPAPKNTSESNRDAASSTKVRKTGSLLKLPPPSQGKPVSKVVNSLKDTSSIGTTSASIPADDEDEEDDWVPGQGPKKPVSKTGPAGTGEDAGLKLLNLLPKPKIAKQMPENDKKVRPKMDFFGLDTLKTSQISDTTSFKPTAQAHKDYDHTSTSARQASHASSSSSHLGYREQSALLSEPTRDATAFEELDEISRAKFFGRNFDPSQAEIQSVDQSKLLGITESERAELQAKAMAKSIYGTKQNEDGYMPTYGQKRKSQMTYLVHQAKAREQQLAERTARVAAAKRLSKQRYGF